MQEIINYQTTLNKAIEKHKEQNFIAAKALYLKLIENNPKEFLPFFLMGALEIDLENYQVAIDFLKKTLTLNEDYLDAYFNLGYCYTITNRHTEAIRIYNKAVNSKTFDFAEKEHAKILRKLARTYVETGNTKEGINTYKKILEFEPDNLYIYDVLHALKAIKLDKALKNRIKRLQKKNTKLYTEDVYAYFLLSKFEREKKEYYAEFNLLKKAHDKIYSNNENKYEKVNNFYLDQLSNLKISFDENIDINFSDRKLNSIKPIFIVGLPRSGSTLLEKIIAEGDSNIVAGEETAAMHILFNQMMQRNDYKDDIQKIMNAIVKNYESRGLLNLDKNIYFTDKSLENFFCLGWIKKIFPNAIIINTKRDPMASVVSIFRSNLFNSTWTHRIEDICRYIDVYYRLIQKWEKEYKIPIYHIQYENLIENFDSETKKLFKFSGLKWKNDLKEMNSTKPIVSKTQSMIQVREPVYDRVNKEYMELAQYFTKYVEKYEWYQNSK